jgi:hypothetical protein
MCEKFETEEQKEVVNDVLTHHAVLCIVAGMMSLHVMRVSSYTVVDLMTVSNENLYVVLARSSSYFRA